MSKLFLLSLATVLWSSLLNAQEFMSGSEFTATDWQGEYVMDCFPAGGIHKVYVKCAENYLTPHETDYFVHPAVDGAKKVRLTSIHEDGSSESKTARFDNKKGRTSGTVNLWIRTLLQTPLLNYGTNKVTYELIDNKKNTLNAGQFEVTVKQGKPKLCPTAYYTSSYIEDCRSSASNKCSQYFYEYQDRCE